MMSRPARLAFALSLIAMAAPAPAFAQTAESVGITPIVPQTPVKPEDVKKQIDAFDPRAVAAAKNYFAQPAVRGALIQVTDNLYQQVMAIVTKQNPKLDNAELTKIEGLVGDPLKQRLDLVVQMSVLGALRTFSTDELVALDKFYSSPDGKAIQVKMPKLMGQVPGFFKDVMPDYLGEVKAKLKADKVEVSFE